MTDLPVYLLAGGGHGSVVLDALRRMGCPVAGIVDARLARGSSVLGCAVVGGDDWLEQRGGGELLLANGAGATPHDSLRRRLFEKFHARGFAFVSVRHPSAAVGEEAVLAEGSQLMAGAVVQCRSRIGRNAVVNTCASVDHDCVVGDSAFIAPGATLCGEVRIGAGAFVGAGAVILPGMSVGAHDIIGAGAVVARAVADGSLVKGVPARGEAAT